MNHKHNILNFTVSDAIMFSAALCGTAYLGATSLSNLNKWTSNSPAAFINGTMLCGSLLMYGSLCFKLLQLSSR